MPVNRGLSAPYEGARRAAHDPRDPREWLLTLDQDTALPEDFFSALAPGLAAAAADPRIAALVPRLAERGRPLSPSAVGRFGTRPLPPSSNGVPRGEIRAFNSAALLRVAALDDVGGFSPCFRLDYLDCWLHHALFLGGWRVYVLGSLQLEHELSLLNYRERISPERFRGFLAAEAAYTDLYGGWPARVAYTARLAVRLFNQRRRGEAAEIRRETRRMLAQRLTRPRSRRLARWRTAQGCGPEAAAASTPDAGPATTSATASVTRSGAAGATAEPPQSVEPDRTKSAAQNGRPDEIAGRAAERGRKRSRKRGRKPGQERGQ
jgi:GT2 family glycosyltransferase